MVQLCSGGERGRLGWMTGWRESCSMRCAGHLRVVRPARQQPAVSVSLCSRSKAACAPPGLGSTSLFLLSFVFFVPFRHRPGEDDDGRSRRSRWTSTRGSPPSRNKSTFCNQLIIFAGVPGANPPPLVSLIDRNSVTKWPRPLRTGPARSIRFAHPFSSQRRVLLRLGPDRHPLVGRFIHDYLPLVASSQ